MQTTEFHPDTHRAAIIWERRNDAVGAIPANVVRQLSDQLRMGFAPHDAVIEVEAGSHFAVQMARIAKRTA